MHRFVKQIKTALNNPENALSLIGHRIGSKSCKYFARLLRYNAFLPEAVNIYPTDRCNLNCSMCFEKLREPRHELPVDTWLEIIDQFARFKPRLHLSGGEPLLYNGIADIITQVKQHGLFLAITTNGTFLEQFAETIHCHGVNTITVSIDGPRKIHDTIRGVKGAFDKTILGLIALARRRSPGKPPTIRINSMLNVSDPETMQEVIRIGMEFNAETIQFIHHLFISQQDLTAHRHYIKTTLGSDLNYWQGAQSVVQKNVDVKKLMYICEDLKRQKGIQIEIFPSFTMHQMKSYYAMDPQFYNTVQGQCHAMWSTATILPSGELESCPDYIIGNCTKAPVKRLWNSTPVKALRERIHQKRFFSVCRACCFFYL